MSTPAPHTITLSRDVGPLWQWLSDHDDGFNVRMRSHPSGRFDGAGVWVPGAAPWVFDLNERGLSALELAFAREEAA